jgi:hypothetical protein
MTVSMGSITRTVLININPSRGCSLPRAPQTTHFFGPVTFCCAR